MIYAEYHEFEERESLSLLGYLLVTVLTYFLKIRQLRSGAVQLQRGTNDLRPSEVGTTF